MPPVTPRAGTALASAISPAARADPIVETLGPRLRGHLFPPGDPGYDDGRAGANQGFDHRPAAVVRVSGVADVAAVVAYATKMRLPVGVLNTGHGTPTPIDDGILIDPRLLRGVRVDPATATARLEAGVRWAEVIHEAAAFGLAPLSGSAPWVGAIGFTLGGGLGLLGRTFGYAADHVRNIDIVTRHGVLRHVHSEQYADLFWALRGGGGNFGVVTSMEIDLFPVRRLYGGGLYFRGRDAATVVGAYRRWARTAPEELGSSVALIRFPWVPEVPAELRGRFVAHVRVAYHGSPAEGETLVRPLRQVAVPLLDTVVDRPYTTSGEIHNDPPEPLAWRETCAHLRELDENAVDELMRLVGPDSSCPLRMVELRHLGGALGRAPAVPNVVGNRDAAFLLYMVDVDDADAVHGTSSIGQLVVDAMLPWSTGGVSPNFAGGAGDWAREAHAPADRHRLAQIKRAYDPDNMFRFAHDICPRDTSRRDIFPGRPAAPIAATPA